MPRRTAACSACCKGFYPPGDTKGLLPPRYSKLNTFRRLKASGGTPSQTLPQQMPFDSMRPDWSWLLCFMPLPSVKLCSGLHILLPSSADPTLKQGLHQSAFGFNKGLLKFLSRSVEQQDSMYPRFASAQHLVLMSD